MEVIDDDPLHGTVATSEALWREHGPIALRLATVLVGPHDAHDVTIAAFLRVAGASNRTDVLDVRRYLLRAVRNEARSVLRAAGRRRRRDLAAVTAASVDDGRPDVDVRRAIGALTERQRTVLFLAYWEDMTEAVIADVLGLSRGTVHRDLERARWRLKEVLR
jgi:RNA polymerase sigma factor (sigma-70 family)